MEKTLKGWPALACIIGLAGISGAAHADPLYGVELGMSKDALTTLLADAGASLDCRDMGAIAKPAATALERCSAVLRADPAGQSSQFEFLLAPNAKNVTRVAVILLQAPTAAAASTRADLIARWGEPNRSADSSTLQWRAGPRALTMTEDCNRGRSFCLEYSDSSWSRQAARATGMDVAAPKS